MHLWYSQKEMLKISTLSKYVIFVKNNSLISQLMRTIWKKLNHFCQHLGWIWTKFQHWKKWIISNIGDEASPDYITWAKGKENLKTYLKKNNKIVVRDHDHFNGNIYYKSYKIIIFFVGKYRGAAHQLCNLNYKKSAKIPCFFHNLIG